MNWKEKLKVAAKLERECADILEELSETEDEEKVQELAVKYALKSMKAQEYILK